MSVFLIRTTDNSVIRFNCYIEAAPITSETFLKALPFSRIFFHARVSGQEIWTDDVLALDIPQENSSVFAVPGEIAIGPVKPSRNKVAGLMGIFYGEGRLVDGGNLFGKVFEEDMPALRELGERIWKQGAQKLTFEKPDR